MSNYKDEELTQEELKEVVAGIKLGNTDEMLDKLGKSELEQFKDVVIKDKELSLSELDNIKAAQPQELVDKMKEENSDLFIKH